jgi:nucleoside-diphosphate-sugar epimerase
VPPETTAVDGRNETKLVLALTGATGFIGGAVAARFLSDGWTVRALVRDPARLKSHGRRGLEPVHGSLSDQTSLERLVDGADAVVHCAGAVRGLTQRDFDQVNVDGLASIVAAASRASCPRFISLSSLAAREAGLSLYATSKREGERILERNAGAMGWVALRPPAVYGPGDPASLPLLRSMMRGFAIVPGSASNRFSLLFVDDLVSGIVVCVGAATAPSGIFELHDGRIGGYDWQALTGIAAGLRGKSVSTIVVPESVLRRLAALSATWGRLRRRAPLVTPAKVNELVHPDWVCDNAAFAEAYSWSPAVEFAWGLRQTLEACSR